MAGVGKEPTFQGSRCSAADGSAVRVRLLPAQDLEAYKVFPGDTALKQLALCSDPAAADDLDGTFSRQHPEWRALYMQFQGEHVVGTVPYRWESAVEAHRDDRVARLYRISFRMLRVLVVEGDFLFDGGVDGAEKARMVKRALVADAGLLKGLAGSRDENYGIVDVADDLARLVEGMPLMEFLGSHLKCAALVQETADEWELIVPHSLLGACDFEEALVASWQRHERFRASALWCVQRNPEDNVSSDSVRASEVPVYVPDSGKHRWEKWEEGSVKLWRPWIPDLPLDLG